VSTATATADANADRAGRYVNGAGAATITQPLINLSAIPLYAQARHTLESERWGSVEDKRQLAFDTARTYIVALSNQRLADAAQRHLERAKANQQDTQNRVEAKLNSVNDATRAQIDTSTAESQLVQAQVSLQKAYLALEFLIGHAVTGPLAVPDATNLAAQRGSFKLEDVIKHAEARRPDVLSAAEKTIAARDFAEEPLYRLAPTLSLVGRENIAVSPLPPAPAHDEQMLLTATWTIYDGGLRYGDRKTRMAQADSSALDEHLLRRSIATDVQTAIAGLHGAREVYRISQEALEAAKKNVDETAFLYRQGLAREIEVTDANASLYDAEVNLEGAVVSMEQAYMDLRQALGFGPIEEKK
jgi:outer membrane protein TolC